MVRMLHRLSAGRIYIIEKADLYETNPHFTAVLFPFVIGITAHTSITAADDDGSIPTYSLNVTTLHDASKSAPHMIDIVVLVTETHPPTACKGSDKKKQVIVVKDTTTQAVVSLWDLHINPDITVGKILLLEDVIFNGAADNGTCDISTCAHSAVAVEPDHPLAAVLRGAPTIADGPIVSGTSSGSASVAAGISETGSSGGSASSA
jgi:hypothetical protein